MGEKKLYREHVGNTTSSSLFRPGNSRARKNYPTKLYNKEVKLHKIIDHRICNIEKLQRDSSVQSMVCYTLTSELYHYF